MVVEAVTKIQELFDSKCSIMDYILTVTWLAVSTGTIVFSKRWRQR